MNYKKYRWSKDYEAAEEELELLLDSMPSDLIERVELEALEQSDSLISENRRRLYCAEGSVMFTISDSNVSIQPGDTLDISAGASVVASAGIAGCVYYEERA